MARPMALIHLLYPGFKKVKAGTSLRPRVAPAGTQGEGESTGGNPDSWEFRHPQFRRGRRDLLVDIKRQKDGGRLKRKQGITNMRVYILVWY